jgi:hypothetical protein
VTNDDLHRRCQCRLSRPDTVTPTAVDTTTYLS